MEVWEIEEKIKGLKTELEDRVSELEKTLEE